MLPRRLAIEATHGNRAVIEQMKHAAARRTASVKQQAEALLQQLDSVSLDFERKAGKDDTLFGSVTSADIAAPSTRRASTSIAARSRCRWKSRWIAGRIPVPVRLHREVTAHIKARVVKREGGDEATA